MPELELASWPNSKLSEFVDAGGVRWHVQRAGTGPKLLLLHGTAASTHSWRDLIPTLAERFTVLAPDLPGHAFTGPSPVSQSSIAGMSNLVMALLEELEFLPEYVVGHSAGAVILANMALGHQINPRVIISVNGAFLPLVGTASAFFAPLAKLMATSAYLPKLLARRAAHPDNVARVINSTGSKLSESGIDLYVRLVQQPAHIRGALRMMSQWDLDAFVAQLPLLKQPLALLVASNDKAVTLEQSIEVMQRVKHATLYPVPELGHLAHEEDPQLIAGRIVQICSAHAQQ